MLKKKSKNPKNCLKITKKSLFFPTFLKKPFLDWDSFLNQAFLNWECTVPDFTDNIQIRLATILFVAPWPCKIRMQQKECNGTNLIFIIWWNCLWYHQIWIQNYFSFIVLILLLIPSVMPWSKTFWSNFLSLKLHNRCCYFDMISALCSISL